jgi:citrate lyase subunit beta/citryl-CoA lyase
MNTKSAIAGNAGPRVRSDCEIELVLRSRGGVIIELESKVKSLYGESIIEFCIEIMSFFKVTNASVRINDSGALPFVIAARLEAVIKKLVETDSNYLPELADEEKYTSSRHRFRFSRLYIPGNTPSMMLNAGLHSADGIILDLEDSVAPDKKYEARFLVRNALRQVRFHGAERMVRINQGEAGLQDLHYVIPHGVNLILIPKCETKEQVQHVDKEINIIRKRCKIPGEIFLMPIIESALGIESAFEIARSSESIVSLAIGLEDYTASIGVTRTAEGGESFYARSRLINAAKAAGIQPVDSVYSDVDDIEGLKRNILESRALGFEGTGCIHPRQVATINHGYTPDNEEIEKAKKIVVSFTEAEKTGLGVVALGSKMIDPPVVARAQRIINLAVKLGKLPEKWIDIDNA